MFVIFLVVPVFFFVDFSLKKKWEPRVNKSGTEIFIGDTDGW